MNNPWIRKSTAIPNILIDQFMPKLRDTEWRLVITITRATLGWVDSVTGRRKEREWLSNRQLRLRTGRESAAISKGLDTLCKAGIIWITDSSGRVVDTPSKRRRARSKLCFGLHPNILKLALR